jgi:uncharacterized membrane protein YbhN (UPF0104 family)
MKDNNGTDRAGKSLFGCSVPVDSAVADRRARLMKAVGTAASVILFLLSIGVLWFIISELDGAEVKTAFARASRDQILLALAFTALSYLMLTGFDWVALKEVTILHISYRITALASFTSYAVSFTLGFPLLTAATVRYWIYSSVGLGPGAIASLTVIAGVTFWLGMVVVLGTVLMIWPASASTFTRLPLSMNIALGAALMGCIGFYLFLASKGPRHFTLQGWRLRLPRVSATVKQMALGAADVCAGAAVLFVLLPPAAEVPFATMLATYVFAVFLGIVSHAPGGIGVFEATMMLALPGLPRGELLGALLVYRLCYYVVPFIVALLLLGTREIMLRSGAIKRQLDGTSREDAS